MTLTRTFMLARARERDGAFNGRFLTGVLSTGIYCLPSCPARNPKPENVRFFASEREALSAGLRPCKRCRPDRFYKGYDPDAEAVRVLAGDVYRSPGAFPDALSMTAACGIGPTKLTQLFHRHFHETPAAFLARQRVERAKERLRSGGERVLDVGLAVGFESTSAFHDKFKRLTGLSPGDFRRLDASAEFRLATPSTLRHESLLAYNGRDPESPCERVRGRTLAKALAFGETAGVLTLELGEDGAGCRWQAADGAPGDVHRAHAAAVRLLALASDPTSFERRVARKLGLSRLIRGFRGLRVPQTADAFEGLVWSIVGQQVNLAFAFALRRRLVRLCGRPAGGGMLAHPTAADVARLDVGDLLPLSFSRKKAEYLIDSSRSIVAGELELDHSPARSAGEVERSLLAVRGLGVWSARYILMRAFGFADCVPVGDAGLTAALASFFRLAERPDAARTLELMAPFAPHRSLATFHLWNRLGNPA